MKVETSIRLADFTTFRIGGKCDAFIRIRTEEELREAIDWCTSNKKEFFILGGGSNVVVADEGFSGAIVRIEIGGISKDAQERLRCGAGTTLDSVVDFACKNGLAGLERFKGIPGTIGGAVRGNAGAFGTQMQDIVDQVRLYNTKDNSMLDFDARQCGFSYRMSAFKKTNAYIITSVVLHLHRGTQEQLLAQAKETLAMRNQRQIQNIQSAGSCFINPAVPVEVQRAFKAATGKKPKEGRVPAGWLLETVGLKGFERDGIAASPMHPNYFINTGNGTARAVQALVHEAKRKVKKKWGVELCEEVVWIQ